MKNQISKIMSLVNTGIEKLSSFLMIFLLFLTFSNVIGRYVFNKSIYFSDELARFMFVWIVFLGIAKIVKDKRQVSVSILAEKFAGSIKGVVLETFTAAFGLLFLVITFIGGVQLTMTMNLYSSAALGIPMGYVYFAVPIGAGLTIIYHITNYVEYLMEYISGSKTTDLEKETK